jgi:hypothetical protein
MIKVLLIIFVSFAIMLFSSNVKSEQVSTDVIITKLDSIQADVNELKDSFKTSNTTRDNQLKEMNSEIIALKLCQAQQNEEMTILWGVFGTLIGGGGVAGGVFLQRKRSNDKTVKE